MRGLLQEDVIDRSPAAAIVVAPQVSGIAQALAHARHRHFDRAIVADNASDCTRYCCARRRGWREWICIFHPAFGGARYEIIGKAI
jgi:hypothetical protein